MQQAWGWKKKKREIPFVRQLLLCWHATALQLRQQPGNPHRAHYWFTCCESVKCNRRIRESKQAFLNTSMVIWDSQSSTDPVPPYCRVSSVSFQSSPGGTGAILHGQGISDYCEQLFLWARFWKCLVWTISVWIKYHLVPLNPTKQT